MKKLLAFSCHQFSLKHFILTLFAVVFLIFELSAQNEVWQNAIVYPGSKNILTADASFANCWERNVNNFDLWKNCLDKNGGSSLNWNQIQPKVIKTFEFTLIAPGYCTYVFESHVPEEVFYHQDPSFSVQMMGADGKWQGVWVGFSAYNKLYKGQNLRSGSTNNKFAYQINPDGTLRYYTVPPHYKPGRYRVIIEAGKRVGAYDLAYVQGSATLQVYFIEEGTTVDPGMLDKPQPGILYYTEKECR